MQGLFPHLGHLSLHSHGFFPHLGHLSQNDIIYHYGLDRPDYYSLMNYFEIRYNLYLDVLKRIEDLENYSCNTMYTIHFNKNNCKFFNDNKNEFVESYLTFRVEKDQR